MIKHTGKMQTKERKEKKLRNRRTVYRETKKDGKSKVPSLLHDLLKL